MSAPTSGGGSRCRRYCRVGGDGSGGGSGNGSGNGSGSCCCCLVMLLKPVLQTPGWRKREHLRQALRTKHGELEKKLSFLSFGLFVPNPSSSATAC